MPSTLRSVDDDVLGVICAILDKNELKQTSLVDKRLREISLPLLLQRVCMQFVYKENVWKLATVAIEGMLASTAFDIVVGNTRFLDIRISDDKSKDPMPSVLPGRLAELLSAPFRQLRTLVFTIDETQAQAFDDEFRTAGIELPTVTTLMVGAYCDISWFLFVPTLNMWLPMVGCGSIRTVVRLLGSIRSGLLLQREGQKRWSILK
ncbi:hypothetical protein ARMGADRAFT_55814 [Armillaria gallica]|uniref:F-box domain-containing protein n=1 Tax=Armillaria gallica TaxID=47427 RepID=A0A2H3EAS8_ARMGA|nr:hypothetical protein ARMGADRAFT_55814 [Armillaria gallica]